MMPIDKLILQNAVAYVSDHAVRNNAVRFSAQSITIGVYSSEVCSKNRGLPVAIQEEPSSLPTFPRERPLVQRLTDRLTTSHRAEVANLFSIRRPARSPTPFPRTGRHPGAHARSFTQRTAPIEHHFARSI